MSGFNQVVLFGRVGQDPEVKYTQAGTAVVSFGLATSRRKKEQNGDVTEVTSWHRVKAFAKQAEVIGEHVKKGDLLFVEGRLDYWEATGDKGGKLSIAEVVVNHFEFGGGRSGGGGSETARDRPQRAPAGAAPRGATRTPPQPRGAPGPAQAPSDPFVDDDIPF